jgi:hypothetical protein
MPILNYTTSIHVLKTVGEIQALLASRASQVATDYGPGGVPIAISFTIDVRAVPVRFRLPCDIRGVLAAMKQDRKVPRGLCNETQAGRVAWRIVKDWVAAQLAFIEAGQARTEEVFLPYALHDDGRTLFQHFTDNTKLLTSGENVIEGKFGTE